MNKKIIAIGSVLSTATVFTAVACGNGTTQSKFAEVQFKSVKDVMLNDTLNASTGSGFANGITTYENDGNENLTTRAGLNVRKSSVISALKNNLGVDSENKVKNLTTFFTTINKLLPENQSLKVEDFADLESVEITIGADSTKPTLFSDLIASSKKSPVVTHQVNIIFWAKEGKTVGAQKVSRLKLTGMQKIRLTDYRRVDISTLQAVSNKPTLSLSSSLKPDTVTLDSIITALNKHFSISSSEFATPFFPIWNESDEVDNKNPIYFIESTKNPVKHSLNEKQISDLQKLYKGTTTDFGDFPRPRIGRAIEKVWFSIPKGHTPPTKLTETNSEYTVSLNANMDFIKHWSWGSDPYSDFIKTFILTVTFKVKFDGPAIVAATGAASTARN